MADRRVSGSLFSHCLSSLAASCLLLGAGPLAAGERPAVLVLDLVGLPPDVPGQVVRRISEILETELANAGDYRLVTGEVVEKLARRGSLDLKIQAQLGRAEGLLEAGITSYENLDFDRALEQIGKARLLLEESAEDPAAQKLMPRVLLYQGVAGLSRGDRQESTAHFEALIRLRPDHRIDEVLFPPEVVTAFGKVKQRVTSQPRGTISFTSSPPFANVIMDGRPRGDTPLIVKDIVPGRHRFVIGKEGHLNWQKEIEVGPGGGLQRQVSLKKNPVLLYRKQVVDALRRGANREETSAAAVKLAGVLGVDYALLGVVAGSQKNYLVSTGLIKASTGSTKKITFALIDSDLLNSATQLKKMAGVLGDRESFMVPASGSPGYRQVLAAWGRPIDFGRHLLGVGPKEAEPAGSSKPISQAVDELAARRVAQKARDPAEGTPPPPEDGDRWYGQWWIWTTVAVVVGGGVATTLILLNQESTGPPADTIRIETVLSPPAGSWR